MRSRSHEGWTFLGWSRTAWDCGVGAASAVGCVAGSFRGEGLGNGGEGGRSASATEGHGPATGRLRSVAGRAGSVTGRPGSVTGRPGSATGRLGSVTGRLRSVTGRLRSVTGRLRSVTGRLGSVTGRLRSGERFRSPRPRVRSSLSIGRCRFEPPIGHRGMTISQSGHRLQRTPGGCSFLSQTQMGSGGRTRTIRRTILEIGRPSVPLAGALYRPPAMDARLPPTRGAADAAPTRLGGGAT